MSTELNREQLSAACHLAGPLLIDAGAGSGKTRTLAQRFVNAVVGIEDDSWLPAEVGQIATITFTEKAAGELAERVRDALRCAGRHAEARRVDSAWISTIHALCSRILRQHALEAGLDPYFRVAEGITASRLEEDAFECAATELSMTSQGANLFATYSYEQVRLAVRTLARAIEVRGLAAEAISLESHADAISLLREAREFFAIANARLGACGRETSATMVKHIEQCAGVVESLAGLDEGRLDEQELAREIRRALAGYTQRRAVKEAADLCEEIAERRATLLSQAVATELAGHAAALQDLARIHIETYRRAKSEQGLLDFDDLQRHTLHLLQNRPDIARRYRRLFRIVMVDEFQDTDALQLALVGELASDNLCTVGDGRQSIYRFRGADIGVYASHNETMERAGARRVSLARNYRSHPDILGFVNALFSHDALFGAQDFVGLLPGRQEPEKPRVPAGKPRIEVVFVHKEGRGDSTARFVECESVAERIEALLDEFEPGECVILLRTYTHAAEYAHALEARSIPAFIVGGSRFFGQAETTYLRAFCRTVVNGGDDEALAMYLGSPMTSLSLDALWQLGNDPARAAGPGGLWKSLVECGLVGSDDREAAREAVELVERARRRLGGSSLSEVILRAVEESAYDLWLLGGGEQGRRAYANVLKLARMAAAFERADDGGIIAFLEYLDAKERLGDHERPAALADEHMPGVRIMSIHASKGLEFPVVVVPELGVAVRSGSGIVRTEFDGEHVRVAVSAPSDDVADAVGTPLFEEFDRQDKAEEAAEAKRLLYVACTRAEEVLVLSGAANLDKPATQNSPLAWVRQAMEMDVHAELDGIVRLAGSDAAVGIMTRDGRTAPAENAPVAEQGHPPSAAQDPRLAHEGACGSAISIGRPGEHLAHVTYSDVVAFETCSLRFLATRLWRVGALNLSIEGDPRRFGTALHALMKAQVDSPGSVASEAERVANRYGLGMEEGERLQAAGEALIASRVWAELNVAENARAEVPFQTGIAHPDPARGFVLAGSMDLYLRRGEQGIVMDYKTGTSGALEVLRDRYEMQARCYALAVLRDGCTHVRLEFVRPEVVDEDGEPQRVSFAYAAADIPGIEDDLRRTHAAMVAGPHVPLSRWDRAVCADCPIGGSVCPLPVPGDTAQRR